ncbi:MAG: ATP-binding protein [Thermodesulfobacteriota bacterium]|nr:ATP-binding protein [Thermodesulfobacteriota bacterium]
MKNPFIYGGLVFGSHFADRQRELSELTAEMSNGGKVFLISPRRMGKTCLLKNLQRKMEMEGFFTAYVDLYRAPTLRHFTELYAKAVVEAVEGKIEKMVKAIPRLLPGFRPKLEPSPDGTISFSVEYVAREKEVFQVLTEVLEYPEKASVKKSKPFVVVIDEFSDITKYNGEDVEKAIRAVVQTHQQVGYIFSGSKRSVIHDMVKDRTRAFYRMGSAMELSPIPRDLFRPFMESWFGKGGYDLGEGVVDLVFEKGRDVPYNIQRIAHNIWEDARESKKIEEDLVEKAVGTIIRQESMHYEAFWDGTPQKQREVLIALASDEPASLFSQEFLQKWRLGVSSLQSSIKALENKGVLERGKQGKCRFDDEFFRLWIVRMPD